MLKLSINEGQRDRIIGKLQKIITNVQQGTLYAVVKAVGNDYVTEVKGKMGTISGYENTQVSFSYGDAEASTTWQALHSVTAARKRQDGGSVTFWFETGAAKDAVRVSEEINTPAVASVFAGITRKEGEAFEHALRTEYGAEGFHNAFPGRALFTLANEVFLKNKERIIDTAKIALLKGVNWGG